MLKADVLVLGAGIVGVATALQIASRGREVVLRLIATADIVSENFKPGTMKKLGLDHETLRNLNPRLIYVSHKGFLPGPYDHRTALDLGARQEHEFAFVKNALGLDFGHIGHQR